MPRLPDDAFDLLTRTLARICDDPYDRLVSMPAGKGSRDRMDELGDSGFTVFARCHFRHMMGRCLSDRPTEAHGKDRASGHLGVYSLGITSRASEMRARTIARRGSCATNQ